MTKVLVYRVYLDDVGPGEIDVWAERLGDAIMDQCSCNEDPLNTCAIGLMSCSVEDEEDEP